MRQLDAARNSFQQGEDIRRQHTSNTKNILPEDARELHSFSFGAGVLCFVLTEGRETPT